jgi:hypothetical protein
LVGLRRQRIEQRLKNLLFQPLRNRLIHLLVELADRYGRPTPEGLLIDVRLSHQDLAGIVGSSRESVTLGLGELVAEGLLRRRGRRLVVVDPKALVAAVGAGPPAASREDVRTGPARLGRSVSGHTETLGPLGV